MFYDDYNLDSYFEWLLSFIPDIASEPYIKLLRQLFETEFTYTHPMDKNRLYDALELRLDFFSQTSYIVDEKSCSVLEMMIALSIRCERDIMSDLKEGDRTELWFQHMIHNLNLSSMNDYIYDPRFVQERINEFLNREYDPDGNGGLFYIPGRTDMTSLEIWYQLNYYLTYLMETDGDTNNARFS